MAKRRPSGDGMVRKREDGRWEGRIVVGHKENGDSIFHYVSTRTQKELLEKLHKSIDEHDGAELSEECRMKLSSWLDIWLNEYAALSVRPSTLQSYRRYIDSYINPQLGNKQVCKITTADVQKFYGEMLANGRKNEHPELGLTLSPASLRHIHGILHQAMDAAVQRQLTVKNPTNGVTLPKITPAPKRILNEEALEQFMEVIKTDPLWHDFFYLDVTTGLRRGELCGLMWSDFDEKKGTLSIRRTLSVRSNGGMEIGETKTSTSRRIIQLPPSTAQLLRERKKKSISQWIFPNPLQPEQPIHPTRGYARLKSLLKEAGLPDIRFHDLRHTFATHALTSGVDARTLSAILGHTKPSFTIDTYTHVTTDMHRKASEIVGGFMKDLIV